MSHMGHCASLLRRPSYVRFCAKTGDGARVGVVDRMTVGAGNR